MVGIIIQKLKNKSLNEKFEAYYPPSLSIQDNIYSKYEVKQAKRTTHSGT